MKLKDILNEKITIDVEIGDTILTGRFKNKKTKVNSIETDQHGMPTINGRKVTTFRTMKKQDESTMMKEGPQRDRNNMALYIIDLNNTLSNAKVLAKKDPKYKKYIKFIEKDIKDAKEKLAKMKEGYPGKSVKPLHDDELDEKVDFKKAHKKFKETGELPPHLKKLVKDLDKVKVKHKVKNIVVPGLEWMADIDEGTCGYSIDGEGDDEPAGPHLLKKENKEQIKVIHKFLTQYGRSAKKASAMIKKNYKKVVKQFRGDSTRDIAIALIGYDVMGESTEKYKKSLEKIVRDKKLKMLSKKDKETLLKIAKLMKSAND